MKKVLSLLLCLGLGLNLVGCGSKEKPKVTHKSHKEVIKILEKNGYELKDRYDEVNECYEVYFKNDDSGNAFALNELINEEYPNTIIFQYDSTEMILTDNETIVHGTKRYDEIYSEFENEISKSKLLEADIFDTLKDKLYVIIDELNEENEKKENDKKISDYIELLNSNSLASKINGYGYEYIYNINESIYNTKFEKKTKSDNEIELYFKILPKENMFTISDGTTKIEYNYISQLGYSKFCVLDFKIGNYDTIDSDFMNKIECRHEAENMNYLKSVFEKEINGIGISIEDLKEFAKNY